MVLQWLQRFKPAQTAETLNEPSRQRLLDDLEEQLILADVGIDLSVRMVDQLRADKTLNTPALLNQHLRQACLTLLRQTLGNPTPTGHPHVVLMVGVNGAGKTTAIGKLAYLGKQTGKQVWIGAGDTFRAAAQEQLAIWSDRAGATVVTGQSKDPAAVLFDTLKQANKAGADVVLLDTAGRLHNQVNLMDELRKIRQAVGKALPNGAQLDAWLVLDATTGQNALSQLALFDEAVGLTGVVLSKWDGSAKGGIVLALADRFKLPIVWTGTGEKLGDLVPFDAMAFVDKLLPDAQ